MIDISTFIVPVINEDRMFHKVGGRTIYTIHHNLYSNDL